jgi:uncharacterized membrane protein YfcA
MKKKFVFSRRGILVVLMFSVCAVLSAICVINYTESIFLVLIGWILLPVLIAKLYARFQKGRR